VDSTAVEKYSTIHEQLSVRKKQNPRGAGQVNATKPCNVTRYAPAIMAVQPFRRTQLQHVNAGIVALYQVSAIDVKTHRTVEMQ